MQRLVLNPIAGVLGPLPNQHLNENLMTPSATFRLLSIKRQVKDTKRGYVTIVMRSSLHSTTVSDHNYLWSKTCLIQEVKTSITSK